MMILIIIISNSIDNNLNSSSQMNKNQLSEVKKYLQKIRKLFNQISKDCNKYVDQFDTINYSLNKIDNLINKSKTTIKNQQNLATRRHEESHSKNTRKSGNTSDSGSDGETEKVKAIIQNCKISTQTLSKKIKVLCNLPTSNAKFKEYKEFLHQKEFKHSESANPREFNSKSKISNNKNLHYEVEKQEQQRKKLRELSQDISRLNKEIAMETRNNN